LKSLEAVFGPNAALVEELYKQYQDNPESVPNHWKSYFDEIEGETLEPPSAPDTNGAPVVAKKPDVEAKPQAKPEKKEAPAAAEPIVPQGVISALFPVTTQTEATITFSYIESDATGFEYLTNGATWIATTSPLTLTGLSPSTTDSVQLRAINDAGPGEALTVNYRTKGEPVVVPEGDWPFFTPTTTAAKTWEWSGRHPKTGMRVRVFIEIP
jgi:hypothetical protein